MALVSTDWSIDRATGNIRYIGDDHGGASPSYATVLELHRWLQDLADDATSSGDDQLDITDENPSARSTDNIITLLGNYNIDDNAAEHLYDGSIIQSGGDEVYDGIVNFGNSDVQIQIIQNGQVLADDWWNYNGGGLNADTAQGISHRFLIKVRTGGSDIDGRRIIGIARRFGYTYSEFSINGTARGNNVLALSDALDLNNQTSSSTVGGWSGEFSDTPGYQGQDVDNDGTTEYYYSKWDIGTNRSINDFYEYMKYITRDGSSDTYYGLSGELFRGITHEISYSSLTGTFDHSNSVTFGNGATAQVIADNGTDTMWVQLLTGVAPSASDSISQSTPDSASATVSSVTDRSGEIKTPFVGQSTGSAIIASYGLGILATDLSASDKVFDLTNTQHNPPNYVTFTVGGVVSGEDRILVGPWDGTSYDNEGKPTVNENQMALATALTADNETQVVIGHANGDVTSIPSDTPSSGYIRVLDDDGFYRHLHYTSYDSGTKTFTIDNTDGQEDFATVNASVGNNVWIAYIDTTASSTSESFTSIYSSPRDLVVKVRDGGLTPIKEFITSATLGSNGGSVTAIRTSDK